MFHRLKKIVLIIFVLILGTGTILWFIYHDSTQPPALTVADFEHLDLDVAAQVIVDKTVAGGAPGSILLIEKDGVRHRATAGIANKETRQAMPDDAPIRIGSISKIYTATVILLLAQEQVIGLDHNINRYLPENVSSGLANANRATVRQLLNHTGGIPDYYTISSYLWSDWTQPITLERTLPIAKSQQSTHLAGEGLEYSNMGYVLLGEIAEQASGESLTSLFKRFIFQPLNLRNTYYNVKHPAKSDVHGYGTLLRPWADTYDWWEHSGPDSGIMATPSDVATFLSSLIKEDGQLKAIGDVMLENLVSSEPRKKRGMGLNTLTAKNGITLIGHTGDVFGYQTLAFAIPDLNALFVAHINCNCDALSSSLIRNIYHALLSDETSESN